MRALALLLVLGGIAEAKTAREFPYPAGKVWPAAVRFLRVDERLKVVEKDADSGYVLFELIEGKRTFAGAAEVVALSAASTRVVVRISDRPAYMEEGLLERLAIKLREELGEPQPPPPADKPNRPDKEPKK